MQTLTYRNDLKDLLAFTGAYYVRSPASYVLAVLFLAWRFPAVYRAVSPDHPEATRILMAAIATLLALAALIAIIAVVVSIMMFVRARGGFLGEHAVSVDDDGISVETARAALRTEWAGVRRIRRTRHRLYVHASLPVAVVIPRNAVDGDAEWDRLFGLIQQYWSAAHA